MRDDGTVQFFNNGELSVYLAHWLRNRGREDRELPIKLFGYHQPRQLPGKPKPKAKRDRCKFYDLLRSTFEDMKLWLARQLEHTRG